MGIETAIIGGGMALGAIGNAYSGRKQAKAQEKAINAQNNRNAYISQRASGMRQVGTSPYEAMLMQNMGSFMQPSATFTPAGRDMLGVDTEGIDINSILQQGGFNVGQDAIMQLLRADPNKQLGAARDQMAGLLETGNPYNTSEMFAALQPVEDRELNQSLATLRGNAGGLGERFGSAMQTKVNDGVAQLLDNQALRRSQINMDSFENAQGRRLDAAQIIGQLTGQEFQNAATASQATNNNLDTLLRGYLGNADLQMRGQLANQSEYGRTQQANIDNQFTGAQFNQMARQAQLAQMLQAIGMGQGFRSTQDNYNMNLLSLEAGLPLPQANPYAGWAGQAVAGAGDAGMNAILMTQLLKSLRS